MSLIPRRPVIRRWVLILISCGAVLAAFLPIGTDPSRQAWLDGGLVIGGGLVLVLCTIRGRYQSGIPQAGALIALALTAVGVVSSAAVSYRFPGGDAFHAHLGFPFRWIMGVQSAISAGVTIEWSLFWPGLMVDGMWWFVLCLGGLMLVGQIDYWRMLGGGLGVGNARQARG